MVTTTEGRWFHVVFITAVLLTASMGLPHGQSGTDDRNIYQDNQHHPMTQTRDTSGKERERRWFMKAVGANDEASMSQDDQISCTFDDGHLCGWKQATDDDFDWTPHSGSTPTKGTGPNGGDQDTPYIFAEVSDPVQKKAQATIYTDYFAPGEYSFSFKWHMYGAYRMGTLTLSKVTKSGGEAVLFRKSGNRGNAWQTSEHTFTATEDTKLVFTGTKRRSSKGDIALDSFVMKKLGDYKMVLSCDFENDNLCSYSTDQRGYNWYTIDYPTTTPLTGPSSAYSGQYYIYAEASWVVPGAATRLLLGHKNSNTLAKPFCLTFAYNMYGCHMGSLRVHLIDSNGDMGHPIWSAQGDKGNRWKTAKVHVDRTDTVQVAFEAIRGWGPRSDIALDLVQIHTGTSCT